MKKKIILFLFCIFLLTGCGAEKEKETEPSQKVPLTEAEDGSVRGAWSVYWDSSLKEQSFKLDKSIESLILFACFYDEDGKLYIPQQLSEMQKDTKDTYHIDRYISFVNDIMHKDNSTTQKSAELLYQLFQDSEQMERQAKSMISLAKEWECEGIEIDFENIGKNQELWGRYSSFIDMVWIMASQENLKVRIVLGSSAPVDSIDFVKGPEYVVMCYNLYGTHSGPGPKADTDFLKKTANKFSNIENLRCAFANGGFIWDSGGNVITSVTTSEALRLQGEYGVTAVRDGASHALTFEYKSSGKVYTVWYGDEKTIDEWSNVFNEAIGRKVPADLWRIE